MYETDNERIRQLISDLARVHALMDDAQARLQRAIEADDSDLRHLRKEALASAELVVAIQEQLLKALKDAA